MAIAYVALGSNLGDRIGNLRNALHLLGLHRHVQVLRASRLYASAAVDSPQGAPPYLNAVVELSIDISLHDLLTLLLSMEQQLGRHRPSGVVNAPRTLDLDLLGSEQEIVVTKHLTVPHPRLHERPFVIFPLVELAPDWDVPGIGVSVSEVADDMRSQGRDREVRVLEPVDWTDDRRSRDNGDARGEKEPYREGRARADDGGAA